MIVANNEIGNIREEARDLTIALRFGCFDLLHAGHEDALDFAAAQADILVMGVIPDEMVRRNKGPERPINTETARVQAIDGFEGVDFSFVAPAGVLSIAGLFRRLRPDVYVEHTEYNLTRKKALFLRTLGIEYIVDDGEKVDSTTDMIARLGRAGAIAHSRRSYATFGLAQEA